MVDIDPQQATERIALFFAEQRANLPLQKLFHRHRVGLSKIDEVD